MLVAAISTMSVTAKAQYMLEKGKAQLNAGVGLSNWGLPVYVGFDYGVHKDVSIGAEASFRSYNYGWKGSNYRVSVFGASANANYHFNSLLKIPKEWDLYAGINVGFYSWNYANDYPGNHNSGLGLGGQIGARYYFNDKIGINLEGGGGNAFNGGKLGITIKL